MSISGVKGRLCNQLIRNLAVSFVARKHNLYVNYSGHYKMNILGIDLFIGKNKFNNTSNITDENYFNILMSESWNTNINATECFFQTKDITNMIYNYLRLDSVKNKIIEKNPFKERYNNNNDILIHIRLTDVEHYNPGIEYYIKAISNLTFEKIYIVTDDFNHNIVKNLLNLYNNKIILCVLDEIKTLQFASTCKHIILSHGSFSAFIGYLSFFSDIYYPEYDKNKIWYGDIFSIPGWNKIKYIVDNDER